MKTPKFLVRNGEAVMVCPLCKKTKKVDPSERIARCCAIIYKAPTTQTA